MIAHTKAVRPIISIKKVNFTYLGEKNPALKNINLEIFPGEFVLILGPSSSGKSSLVNLLNGTIPSIFEGDLEGDIIVDGLNTRDTSVFKMATIVGQVFQDPEAQIVNVFVKDEVYFGPENINLPVEEIRANADEAISLVGIKDLIERDIFMLSGGQKQKVALAAVLSMKPKILVLDQPTANLDPHSTAEVFRLIGRLNKELGITVLVIEHNVDELVDLVDKVVVMDKGEVVSSGTPRDIFGGGFSNYSEALGLWMPQLAEMALRIKESITFDQIPLTVAEALPAVKKALAAIPPEQVMMDLVEKAPLNHSDPQIEIKNLTFSYKVNNFQALSNLNLTIRKGDFISIIGKNGSGKSTLAKILTKINDAPRNSVFIYGRDITQMSLFDTTKTIGYVFQNPDHQFVTDTVYDEVAYSLRVRGVDEDTVKTKVMEVLTRFGLEDFVDVSPFALSMGYRRLLSVTTMLVVDQDVIILDEPTIGQDQVSCNLLMGFLKKLNEEGKTIILITHDMRLISEWVGRVVIMADSQILFEGPIYSTFQSDELMDRAAITKPPLVELVTQLRHTYPHISEKILTPDQFCRLFQILRVSTKNSDGI
jgi:energy-coupling factor transport system ATP-binding protein